MHKAFALAVVPLMAIPMLALDHVVLERKEEAAVRASLQHYLDGHATGQREVMARAFHPEARLTFMRDGQVAILPVEDYLAGMRGTPPADEAERKRWIESVDVAGDAAAAKVILDYPDVRFVDYMTLLKKDGEWRIVNKSFYAERKGE